MVHREVQLGRYHMHQHLVMMQCYHVKYLRVAYQNQLNGIQCQGNNDVRIK
jgi:hypothetical protein